MGFLHFSYDLTQAANDAANDVLFRALCYAMPAYCLIFIRSAVTKYLVQWDDGEHFALSQVGPEVSHAEAARWSKVVDGTRYQYKVRRLRL